MKYRIGGVNSTCAAPPDDIVVCQHICEPLTLDDLCFTHKGSGWIRDGEADAGLAASSLLHCALSLGAWPPGLTSEHGTDFLIKFKL